MGSDVAVAIFGGTEPWSTLEAGTVVAVIAEKGMQVQAGFQRGCSASASDLLWGCVGVFVGLALSCTSVSRNW